MIKTRTYPIKNLFLVRGVLSTFVIKFWNEVYNKINKINSNQHLMILVKVEFTDDQGYRTLWHLRRVNFEDRDQFIDYLVERLGVLNDSYTSISVNKITFTYIIRDGLATGTKSLLLNLEDRVATTHRFNNMNLPVTMISSEYGDILSKNTIGSFTRYIVTNIKRTFKIDVSLDNLVNNVTLIGQSDLKWTDTVISDGCFKREIGKSTIYFLDGVEVLRKQTLAAKPFKKLQGESKLRDSFVTFDIETIRQNNKLVPYLICAYNGSEYITSYANSSLNQNLLFSNFIKGLLTFFKKGMTLYVYAHNLSNFDGVFLMNNLVNYGKLEPLLHNGKLISIKIKLNIEGFEGKTIIFKDSMLLLPVSLRKLCEVFNIEAVKSYFPFKLYNIFYTGVLPKLEFWSDITPNIYNNLKSLFKNKMWNFQQEAIKYCKLDCASLHEILSKFNEFFFNKYQINIHSALTAPSLAMRLYKTHFMPENTVYQLSGNVEQAIRESYSGGAVDVYKPHNKIGSYLMSKVYRTIKCFDVNSLYPTVMAQQPIPIGLPTIFDGDIRKMEPNAYGFFYCKINSPAFLEHPLLQRRIKTSEGIRTIAGLGSWEGWICSAEMDNAIKYGYSFQIIKGYTFETGDIFSKFITSMYNLRLEFDKTHPMNYIAKLMMNSLYGKFGMRNEFTRIDIYSINTESDKVAFKDLLKIWGTTIKDFMLLENHLIVVRDSILDLRTNPDQEVDNFHGIETNIAIASAITAGARIYMSIFKNNPKFHLFYSDTDSINFHWWRFTRRINW